MARMEITTTPIDGLMLISRAYAEDARGGFSRLFCDEDFKAAGWTKPVRQANHTVTRKKGAVRGMHFQLPPFAEEKLVACVAGEVFDVAVDLRRGSPTFLQWRGEALSEQNRRSLFIPQGFAHGFQALTDDVQLIYFHSAPYAPGHEGGLRPDDPAISVRWPLAITDLSERDARHSLIDDQFEGIAV